MKWVKASDEFPKEFPVCVRNGETVFSISATSFTDLAYLCQKHPRLEWAKQSDETTSHPAPGSEERLICQNPEKYYPVECSYCKWIGCSCDADGGGQIADTGDYSDPICPKCGSEVSEYETNVYPTPQPAAGEWTDEDMREAWAEGIQGPPSQTFLEWLESYRASKQSP